MFFLNAFFFRLNLSRWTRRTRPTHWCLWPPCPRSPSTNPLSTGSLHQKMGPAPAPQLTGTLPVGPLWLTLRCESHFHLLYCDTSTQDPVHAGTAVTAEAAFTFLLPFFFLTFNAFTWSWVSQLWAIFHLWSFYICCRIPFSFGCFQDTGVSWFLKLGYDVYMHKHKNGISKNPIKTKMLKSIQTHGHQPWSTWSYDHNSNAHNVKSWGSLCFQVNKRNLLSSNDLA